MGPHAAADAGSFADSPARFSMRIAQVQTFCCYDGSKQFHTFWISDEHRHVQLII